LLGLLQKAGAVFATDRAICVPDEIDAIRQAIHELVCATAPVQLVLLTGGTGVSPRDVTPEALEPMWTKKIPGVGECLRANGAINTPMSWISRSAGGFVERTLVISLPGSPKAVTEGWSALEAFLPHALELSFGSTGGRH
jgi:molybdenum cofactor synthesis domain-containing protein